MTDHAQALTERGGQLAAARQRERAASAALREAVMQAVSAGMSEAAAARHAGVTRMTVRAFLGKQQKR